MMLEDDADENDGGKDKKKGYAKGVVDKTFESFENTGKRVFDFGDTISAANQSAIKLNQTLGGSGSLAATITTNFIDAGQKILLLTDEVSSLEQGMLKAAETNKLLMDATGRAYIASAEELAGIIASQEASGVQAEKLLTTFKGQGYALEGIPKTIQKVIDTTRQLGVNSALVTKSVVDNLEKLNTYNFANGVDGLTRMAAQAAVVGVDLSTTFAIAEKMFDPEQAVELASSLQRLGVATGDLLDPLKLMDLGQNNPQELQNQIVEMSKRFTYFNEQNQKFEILPGAKLQLREVAKELGMNADELARMAIGSSTLADKMSKITFPELKTGPLSEDQKTMIANLSEMKDGEYKIKIQETTVDEKGERRATGRVLEEKSISQLTDEDIKSLQYAQKEGTKTLEEIALESMSYQKRSANALESFASIGRGALVSSNIGNKGQEFLAKTMSDLITLTKESATTKGGREFVNEEASAIRKYLEGLSAAYEDGKISEDEKKQLLKSEKSIEEKFSKVFGKGVDVFKKLGNYIEDFPGEVVKAFDAATEILGSESGEPITSSTQTKDTEPTYMKAQNADELMNGILKNNFKDKGVSSQQPVTNNNQSNQNTNNTTNNTSNNQTTNQSVQNNYQQNTFNQIQQMMSQLGSVDFSKMFDLNSLTSLEEKQLTVNEGSYSELKNLNSILTSNNQTLIGHLTKMTTTNENIAQNKENKNITNEVLIDPSKLITQNNQNPTEIKNNFDQSVNNAVSNITNDNRSQTTTNSNVKNNNEFVTNNTESSPIKIELPKVESMPSLDLNLLITNQDKQFTFFENKFESMNKGLMKDNAISDLTLSIRDLDKKINQGKTITPPLESTADKGLMKDNAISDLSLSIRDLDKKINQDKTIIPPLDSTVNNNITNNTQELTNVDKSNNSPVTNITNDNKNLATNNTNYNNDNKFITNNNENQPFPKIELPTFEVPKFDNLSSLFDNQYEKFDLMLDKLANKDNMFSDSNAKLITMLDNIDSPSLQNTPTQATTPTNTDFNIPPLQIAQPTNVQTPNITNITNNTSNNLTENMSQMATNTTSSMSYSGELKLTVDVTAPPGVDPNMVKEAIHKTLHNINVQESIIKNVTGGRVGSYNPTTGIPV